MNLEWRRSLRAYINKLGINGNGLKTTFHISRTSRVTSEGNASYRRWKHLGVESAGQSLHDFDARNRRRNRPRRRDEEWFFVRTAVCVHLRRPGTPHGVLQFPGSNEVIRHPAAPMGPLVRSSGTPQRK